jgi:hypothetical protein
MILMPTLEPLRALGTVGAQTLHERAEWLSWTILRYTQFAKLYQPPLGNDASK